MLEDAGLPVDSEDGKNGIGGPLVAVDNPALFDTKVKELDEALDLLDTTEDGGASPADRQSSAGPADLQHVRRAQGSAARHAGLHSGMDFRAPIGLGRAASPPPGVVIKAGWNGGYGRMVEVDHGNGFSTRYGHLSKIASRTASSCRAGDVVGKVGSSGRSTGPHLHYEVRRNGDAINPLAFLKAGKKVGKLLYGT